jgi:ubiquinone/menaquinone biosynthesis C-methylase UbiE
MKAIVNDKAGFTEIDQLPSSKNFEYQYIRLRQKEGWFYNEEAVKQLPLVNRNDPHYKEWKIRHHSALRLKKYLGNKKKPLSILEVGCGNGWLSNMLASIAGSRITGIDINAIELNQAKKVFERSAVIFKNEDIRSLDSQDGSFDIIVFAASIQYFPLLKNVIEKALALLNPAGEVHILDTHFYNEEELPSARKRTVEYFSSIGFASFSMYYFHHGLESLNKFNLQVLYTPSRLHFFGRKNPFHWYCVKK